jgi:hypothetical protein
MDHMIMIVELDQPYLVDVGFGEFFFIRPVPLSEEVIEDISGAYRVVIDEETGNIMTPYASRRKIKYNGRKQERGRFLWGGENGLLSKKWRLCWLGWRRGPISLLFAESTELCKLSITNGGRPLFKGDLVL